MRDALKQLPPPPFSLESRLQRGLFPIQDTRPLDNTRGDLKATQRGRNRSTKLASVPLNSLREDAKTNSETNAFTCKRTCAPAQKKRPTDVPLRGWCLFQWFDSGNHDIIRPPSHLCPQPQRSYFASEPSGPTECWGISASPFLCLLP